MSDLATRIEQAQPGQEDDLLEELWDACPHAWGGYNVRARFRRMLDAEAWLSAVEMLVPEGLAWTCGKNVHHGYWHASFNKLNEDGEPISAGCSNATATPALALAAAIAWSLCHE